MKKLASFIIVVVLLGVAVSIKLYYDPCVHCDELLETKLKAAKEITKNAEFRKLLVKKNDTIKRLRFETEAQLKLLESKGVRFFHTYPDPRIDDSLNSFDPNYHVDDKRILDSLLRYGSSMEDSIKIIFDFASGISRYGGGTVEEMIGINSRSGFKKKISEEVPKVE